MKRVTILSLTTILCVAAGVGGYLFAYPPRAKCPLLPGPSGGLVEVCPISIDASPLGPASFSLMEGSGIVAGVRVTNHFPSGVFSLNSAATSTPVPTPIPDMDLDPATMRVVSVEPLPVLVQKPDGVHVEYIYNSGIVAPEDAVDVAGPRLVPGGVVFRDQFGTVRVFALGDGGVIEGLPASGLLAFVASSTRYLTDGRDVYFFNYKQQGLVESAQYAQAHRVSGADAETFIVLYPEADFARDAAHFFLNGEVVRDMNPKSVRPLPHRNDPGYYSGMDTQYYDDTWLYMISFATVEGNPYVGRQYDRGIITKKALKDVYYRKVQDVDPQCSMPDKRYMIKSDGVWYGDLKMSGVDSAHFELIVGFSGECSDKSFMSYEYARDETSVYYQGERMPDADRETFLPFPLNPTYASDRTHVYFGDRMIPNADPSTFEPLWFPIYEGCTLSAYARDAQHVFYKDTLVQGADLRSFTPLIDGYGRDARGVYRDGVLRPDIDLRSFRDPVCQYG